MSLSRDPLPLTLAVAIVASCGTQAVAQTCSANSISSLKACIQGINSYSEVVLTNDITCSSGTDCCLNGGPLINLDGKTNKTIRSASGSYMLRRTAGQRTCSAISGVSASNITIRDLILDEDSAAPPCSVPEWVGGCKEAVFWYTATNVTMNNVKIRHGKSYVVYVWATNGFTFTNSELTDSGIIGLYVGHTDYGPSANVLITNNTFLRSRTNGLAVQGVTGSAYNNVISGNTFSGNHWQGLWEIPPGSGVWSGGGQVYLARGDNIDFDGNTISHGSCSNCWDHYVEGLELGEPDHSLPVRTSKIRNNTIYNNHDHPTLVATWFNITMDDTVRVTNNNLFNNKTPQGVLQLDQAYQENNILKDYRIQVGWESATDYPNGWSTWQTCTTGGQIVRWSAPGEPMEGSYALRMISGNSTSCDAVPGSVGLWTRGLTTSITPGTTVYLNNWTRNGGWSGKICLLALNGAFAQLGESCQSFTNDSWRYDGDPVVQFTMPSGTSYFQVKVGLQSPNGYADLDNLRVTW